MCGIFGLNILKESTEQKYFNSMVIDLFKLSESRGKEASGLSVLNNNELKILKVPFQASKLLKTNEYKNLISEITANIHSNVTLFGHSRLVTNGYEHFSYNNQPVFSEETAVIHNGIVVNYKEILNQIGCENPKTDLDSEVLVNLFDINQNSRMDAFFNIKSIYSQIIGMTTFCLYNKNFNNLLLATNNGSLYYYLSTNNNLFVFASEFLFISQVLSKNGINFNSYEIKQLYPNSCLSINLNTNVLEALKFESEKKFSNLDFVSNVKNIFEIENNYYEKVKHNTSLEHKNNIINRIFIKDAETALSSIEKLKRCTKCILPETFPFIEFDDKGVCNYCNHYSKINILGTESFDNIISEYCDSTKSPNVLIPFSGGRDSSYVMHYLKDELNLNPIAFSYDWGMLTDLARRNQSRMCGKLGIEHILISADIRKKRRNIKLNVEAWLKRPNLGTIPLFMAGDKYFLFLSNQILKENKLRISLFGENLLETTKFKSGFCGIKPNFDSEKTYSLSSVDKIRMSLFYAKEYLINPSYINDSIFDTIEAFKSYYVIQHKSVNLFDYLKWDETLIEDTLINGYNWETDPETKTTWRIGDGTAAFYNYIYYIVAGFTENDTFRSNQIREGMITREEAMKRASEDNMPRWNSINWYCQTIDVDFESTIKIINKIPKLYESK